MELRVLQYFLAIAKQQSISGAAESLHLSQPTLSRQIKDMEDELGKQLLIRGNRKITLTEEGMILRKRAEEIMELIKKTENEIMLSDKSIEGDIYIGAGETDAVRFIAKVAQKLKKECPLVHYHILSGDSVSVLEQLDKGLIDFGLLLNPIDISKYDFLELPVKDVWGVLMRCDSLLAKKETISPEDLWDKPIMISRQAIHDNFLFSWLNRKKSNLNIVATYNLIYNASLMVDEGMGYALCIDKIINTTGNTNLCFRPFNQKIEVSIIIAWKKHSIFTKASKIFLLKLKEIETFFI